MRRIVLFLAFFCSFSSIAFTTAYANSDYVNDYTYIDCANGDDATAEPFNSSKPYSSLAGGVEATTNYINNHEDIKTTSGAIFNIKASCNIIRNSVTNVNLNFFGTLYNNSLVIEGAGEEGLILSDVVFTLPPYDAGNIIFQNAKFIKNSLAGYYFTRLEPSMHSFSSTRGIKILDSYINLNVGTQLGAGVVVYWTTNYGYHSTSENLSQIYIQNSLVDIETPNNTTYTFYLPALIKDSKINFSSVSDVSTILFSKNRYVGGLSYSAFISNEIDLGGNNFISYPTILSVPATFINNKFTNVGTFDVNTAGIYLNNLIENSGAVDISANPNVYNNVFSGDFIDSSDPHNLRKNYNINSIGPKGVGWIFKKIAGVDKDFQINYSSTSLYKEITGKTIPNAASAIYLLFD